MLCLYVKRYNFVGTFIINLVIFIIGKICQESIDLSLYCKYFISLRLAQYSTVPIYPSSSSAAAASVTTKSTEATSVTPCPSMTVNRNVNVVSPSISSHAGIANVLMGAPEPIISTSGSPPVCSHLAVIGTIGLTVPSKVTVPSVSHAALLGVAIAVEILIGVA